jgi:hypothetical protein
VFGVSFSEAQWKKREQCPFVVCQTQGRSHRERRSEARLLLKENKNIFQELCSGVSVCPFSDTGNKKTKGS